jgi:hypothetical protein
VRLTSGSAILNSELSQENSGSAIANLTFTTVPEPSSLALALGVGVGMLTSIKRFGRKSQA